MTDWQYKYKVTLDRVVDADTIDVFVDLGLHTLRKERLRLYKIDAWETRGEEREKGLVAKAALEQLLEGKTLAIETYKDKTGKYGRFLATVWAMEGSTSINVNEWLVEQGHAEYVEY
jgi:micrococcal nuclease